MADAIVDPGSCSVIVAMMNIRIVLMRMRERRVTVWMRMGLAAIPVEIMLMLVMAVVAVFMHMLHLQVFMLVFMGFRQVQPNTAAHQRCGDPEKRSGYIL